MCVCGGGGGGDSNPRGNETAIRGLDMDPEPAVHVRVWPIVETLKNPARAKSTHRLQGQQRLFSVSALCGMPQSPKR